MIMTLIYKEKDVKLNFIKIKFCKVFVMKLKTIFKDKKDDPISWSSVQIHL